MRTGYLVGTGSSLETTRFSKLRICYYLCDFLATNEPVEVHESFVSWKLNTNRAYTCRNQEINKIQSWLVWPKFHCLHHSVFLSGWKNLLNLTYNLEKRNLRIKSLPRLTIATAIFVIAYSLLIINLIRSRWRL